MDGSDQGRPPPKPTSRSIQRPPGLWFDDGNNVIQAENYQFRIHRGILSARSPVFHRLFSEPASEGSQTVEGCPVTHLQNHGKDVENLLLAIYDPSFFEPPPKDVPVEIVLSVALLSHKYEIKPLRRRAILHMERHFPLEMDAFVPMVLDPDLSENSWFRGLETMVNTIITAIHINALWVLPPAYYYCAEMTLTRTFRNSPSWNDPDRVVILRDILTGKIKLDIMDVAYVDFLASPPCSGCLNRESCALHLLRLARGLPSWLTPAKKGSRWKYHTLGHWWNRKWLKEQHCGGLCSPCASACMSAYESARGDYWDKIPLAFNLSGWKELRSLREADINE